jgi:hypothetical protein
MYPFTFSTVTLYWLIALFTIGSLKFYAAAVVHVATESLTTPDHAAFQEEA